jgi:hypothetical protein
MSAKPTVLLGLPQRCVGSLNAVVIVGRRGKSVAGQARAHCQNLSKPRTSQNTERQEVFHLPASDCHPLPKWRSSPSRTRGNCVLPEKTAIPGKSDVKSDVAVDVASPRAGRHRPQQRQIIILQSRLGNPSFLSERGQTRLRQRRIS